ncbi:MAG: glycosyltransferase family 2 protein [Candidatus Hydrogenedentes bacterium]|nr:glycosyltransferase family 2 protein [Candidatus Hydrogenedentota bacterium]
MSRLVVHEDHIEPVRGLVFARSSKGHALKASDLERWLRLNRMVFKTSKVDILMNDLDLPLLRTLIETGTELDTRVSLRTDCSSPAPRAADLQTLGLLDVCLCPGKAGADVTGWLAACKEAGILARVQIPLSLLVGTVPAWIEEGLTSECVSSVNIAAWDPFSGVAVPDTQAGGSALQKMNELARELSGRELEVNLLHVPFCYIDEANRPLGVGTRQFYLEHTHYQRDAYELARKLYTCGPIRIRQIILTLLGIHTSTDNPIDRILLPWIWSTPWVRARAWAAHKILRHVGWRKWESEGDDIRSIPEAAPASTIEACAGCRLRAICDGMVESLAGLAPRPANGEPITDPFHYSTKRPMFFDAPDSARLAENTRWAELAECANATIRNRPPDREIDSFSYSVEGNWSFAAPGSLRWYSFARSEKLSTPIARLDPPFTLSVTVGGGIAEYVGFALGRASRIMCPMTAYTHRIVLHVEASGHYVLLRDGRPVRPVEFSGNFYVPTQLGAALEPRICVRNIDGTIATQAVQLWQGRSESQTDSSRKSVSIVTVCTRYARRLQACLLSVAHQREIDLSQVEVLVAHVPGLDATGDVIDSVRAAYSDLDIVTLTFSESLGNAKGLMLNEAFDKARGEWVMVLDADVILPPTMLSRIVALSADCKFVVPDGRKMLDRATTARLLLGEVAPWETWEELLSGPGEYRRREVDGVPIGYCQCVRRECLEKVRYEEANHFEGADWRFGKDMRDIFGEETRLSGMPVLHLDHGSSNWYGATRHY